MQDSSCVESPSAGATLEKRGLRGRCASRGENSFDFAAIPDSVLAEILGMAGGSTDADGEAPALSLVCRRWAEAVRLARRRVTVTGRLQPKRWSDLESAACTFPHLDTLVMRDSNINSSLLKSLSAAPVHCLRDSPFVGSQLRELSLSQCFALPNNVLQLIPELFPNLTHLRLTNVRLDETAMSFAPHGIDTGSAITASRGLRPHAGLRHVSFVNFNIRESASRLFTATSILRAYPNLETLSVAGLEAHTDRFLMPQLSDTAGTVGEHLWMLECRQSPVTIENPALLTGELRTLGEGVSSWSQLFARWISAGRPILVIEDLDSLVKAVQVALDERPKEDVRDLMESLTFGAVGRTMDRMNTSLHTAGDNDNPDRVVAELLLGGDPLKGNLHRNFACSKMCDIGKPLSLAALLGIDASVVQTFLRSVCEISPSDAPPSAEPLIVADARWEGELPPTRYRSDLAHSFPLTHTIAKGLERAGICHLSRLEQAHFRALRSLSETNLRQENACHIATIKGHAACLAMVLLAEEVAFFVSQGEGAPGSDRPPLTSLMPESDAAALLPWTASIVSPSMRWVEALSDRGVVLHPSSLGTLHEERIVRATAFQGWSPLHAACMWGNTLVLRLLTTVGHALEATNRFQQTPLHIAAWSRSGRSACVELLRAGANPLAQDSAGLLPWKSAETRGIGEDVVELLKSAALGACSSEAERRVAEAGAARGSGHSPGRRRRHKR
jgi:hypothetical protein